MSDDKEILIEILHEMINDAVHLRCMACSFPLAVIPDVIGCIQGDCSFRPTDKYNGYNRWKTKMLLISQLRYSESSKQVQQQNNQDSQVEKHS